MLRNGWQVTSELGAAAGAYRREQRGSAGEQTHEAADILVHWTGGIFRGFVCLFFNTED